MKVCGIGDQGPDTLQAWKDCQTKLTQKAMAVMSFSVGLNV